MAIFRPGERHRYHHILSKRKGKRNVAAALSLTAMVDMFTVLVIFLLQNYNATGEILYIPKEVTLPKASSTKELKPAHVITISAQEITLDAEKLLDTEQVKLQEEWLIQPLYDAFKANLESSKIEAEAKLAAQIRTVVEKTQGEILEDKDSWRNVTIQADKGVDILLVKKVLLTITEAGAGQINFAVNKITEETKSE